MAFTKLDKDMAIIAKLDDEPNDVGGLTAAQLKAKFDEAGESIKKFLNESLLGELSAGTAAARLGAVLGGETVTVQGALDELQAAGVRAGNVPAGGSAGDILRKKSGRLYDLEWAALFAVAAFAAEDWVKGEDGYTLTIPRETHRRENAAFGCVLRHDTGGGLTSNTWAVLGTQSRWDADTGNIVLTSPDAYGGQALFFDAGAVPEDGTGEDDAPDSGAGDDSQTEETLPDGYEVATDEEVNQMIEGIFG